jgi:hypothetical protein
MVRKGTEFYKLVEMKWIRIIGDGCLMEYVERINWGLNNMMGI